MRISSTLAITFAATATATPVLVARDTTVYTNAIDSVNSTLLSFDSRVLTITSSSDIPAAISDLQTLSAAIVSAISTGNTNIAAAAPLSLTEAIAVATPASNLGTTANKTLSDLIAKKDVLSGSAGDVVNMITNIKAQVVPFEDTVVSKVPTVLQSTVRSVGDKVINSLNAGIVAFGGTVTKANSGLSGVGVTMLYI